MSQSSLLHVSTQRSVHAAAVLDLHLLSNQGQIVVPGRREEETEVPLLQQVTHALQTEIPEGLLRLDYNTDKTPPPCPNSIRWARGKERRLITAINIWIFEGAEFLFVKCYHLNNSCRNWNTELPSFKFPVVQFQKLDVRLQVMLSIRFGQANLNSQIFFLTCFRSELSSLNLRNVLSHLNL